MDSVTQSALTLLDAGVSPTTPVAGAILSFPELSSSGLAGLVRRHAFRCQSARFLTHRLDLMRRPLNKGLLLRLLSRGACWLEDINGTRQQVTLGWLGGRALKAVRERTLGRQQLRAFIKRLGELARARPDDVGPAVQQEGRPLFLRTDLIFGLTSGGSVGHIAGVANNLALLLGGCRMFSTDRIPTVTSLVDTHLVQPAAYLQDSPELRQLLFSEHFADAVISAVGQQPVRFVYQRYSLGNISGVLIARHLAVPLVLEYNGSEIWVNRHWGGARLAHGRSLERIEQLNITRAHLVVAVSDPLKEELIERGVPANRVLVNPNGVDTSLYRPDVDGSAVRTRYGMTDDLVVGFIGTFGPWHGAEVLAAAAVRFLARHPDLRGRVRFLFVGDGQRMPTVREIVARAGVQDRVVFTGSVPQVCGAEHLAACDILVSPHVPNTDGSRFFGSPTKLFEYMAMGRPIVASRLEQIAEVLEDGVTALLVPPGDPEALSDAIACLVDDPALRARLGIAARSAVERNHTWKAHTERIIEALDRVCRGQPAHVGPIAPARADAA